MVKIWDFMVKYRVHLIVGPILKLAESVFELFIPLVMADIVDFGISNGDMGYVIRKSTIVVLLGIAGLICTIGCQYLAAESSQGIGMEIRDSLFKKINTMSYEQIDEKGTSSLINRITNDVNRIQNAIGMAVRLASRAPFLLIGSLVMSVMIDSQLSIIFFITVPLIALSLYIIMRIMSKVFKVIQQKLDALSLLSRENLDGVRVIRAFSKQESEIKRFGKACEETLFYDIKACRVGAFFDPSAYLITNFAIIAIVCLGAQRVFGGSLLQGKIIALVNYMTQILMSLFMLTTLIMLFTRAYASSKRVLEVLNTEPELKDGALKGKDLCRSKTAIEFKDVKFSYKSSSGDNIDGISLSIEKNQTIGIIGGTGSGKSTFVNLISRFYDVSEGEILINGTNIKEYSLEEIRKKVGIVPQKALLFTGTIESNLKMGNEKATYEEITNALKISQAYEFVSKLPEGINKKVERGGKNLSGGQKQRLTIARALLSFPEILILDDSASALDAATEAKLRASLKEMKDITVIIVSQKISSIRNTDKIYVFDEGTIAGSGTHDELLKNCSVYNEIYHSQVDSKEG